MSGKVALVIGQLGYGGAERQVAILARGIKLSGWQVKVICLSEDTEPFGRVIEEAGVELIRLSYGGHYDISRLLKLATVFRQEKFDIVHSHLEEPNIYVYLALKLAGVRKTKFIPSALSLPVKRSHLKNYLLSQSFRNADAIHVNSQAGLVSYADYYNVPCEKFRVIYNGAKELPEMDDSLRIESRSLFAINENELVTGTLSKNAPDKNVSAFSRLVHKLAVRMTGIRGVVAGLGLNGEYVHRDTEAMAIAPYCRWLGPVDDVVPVLASMDVFVLTSLREGLPNVVMEAMIMGLPVVAYNAGGTGELIEDGVSGIVVPPGDEQKLFRSVFSLLNDPERRCAMGKAARIRMKEKFSEAETVRSTLECYEEVLKKKNSH